MFSVEAKKCQQELQNQRWIELKELIDISIDDYRESLRLHDEIVLESGASDHRLIHEAEYPICHRLGPEELSHIAVCLEIEDVEFKQRNAKQQEYPQAPFLDDVSIRQQQRNQQLYLRIKLKAHRQVINWQEALG